MAEAVSIPLANGGVALVDAADAHLVEGIVWRGVARQHLRYAQGSIRCRSVYMHRLITGGEWTEVDHRDGNGLDTGIWLGASFALGRDCPVTEPYQHICGSTVVGRMTGRTVRLWRKECAACLQEANEKTEPSGDLPPVDPEVLAAEARRYAEHEGDE